MKESRNRWVAEAVALLLPVLLVSSPFLFTGKCLLGREFRSFFMSRLVYAQEMTARDGEWPRWNGRQHAGAPFLGDLHGSLHYPPNLLYLAIAPERAFGFLFVFHMMVATIGMYRLGRYFEFRRSAAVLGGVAYGISFSVAAHMSEGSPSHYVVPALAPWVLLLILRMIKRISMIRIVLLSGVIGAVLLGGSPRDLPFLGFLSVGLIVWTAIDAARRKRPWRKSALAPIALSVLLGAALASATLLPALEVRAFAAAATAPAGVTKDWRLLYVGVLPTLLALLPFQAPKRGPTLFFAISAAAAALPGLPFCSLWAVALCLAGLAAVGWDGLARGRYPSRNIARILALSGGLAVVAAGLAFWRLKVVTEAAVPLGLLGLSALVLTKLRSHPRAILAAVLLTAGDLWFFDAREIRTVTPEEYDAPPWYASRIGTGRDEYRLYDLTTPDASP
ncbi:MAG: hypothetical protein HY293_13740, partial [Planctomycetes bacterium]|nr:hypothetical protein [Planctomycetota bacterium]